MSPLIIAMVGVAVFAITVWGSVMAAGVAMSKVEIEQDPDLRERVDPDKLEGTFPLDLEY